LAAVGTSSLTEVDLRSLPQIRLPDRPKGISFELPRVSAPRFEVKAAAGVISILGVIGDQATAASISSALKSIGNRPVRVELNSIGGDYFEGAGIYNLLARHSAGVTVQILGVAASAASLVAMAGSRIEIARNAQMMIHRSWTVAVGNTETMADAAAMLGRIDEAMVDVYATRSGQEAAKVEAMMEVETFMSSAQAVELGFADRMLAIDGDPHARAVAGARNGRDLAEDLHRVGYSRRTAERIAAQAWPELASDTTDFSQLVARIQRATADLRKGT
jgi:ATP-dependent Clp protease protease subunit